MGHKITNEIHEHASNTLKYNKKIKQMEKVEDMQTLNSHRQRLAEVTEHVAILVVLLLSCLNDHIYPPIQEHHKMSQRNIPGHCSIKTKLMHNGRQKYQATNISKSKTFC